MINEIDIVIIIIIGILYFLCISVMNNSNIYRKNHGAPSSPISPMKFKRKASTSSLLDLENQDPVKSQKKHIDNKFCLHNPVYLEDLNQRDCQKKSIKISSCIAIYDIDKQRSQSYICDSCKAYVNLTEEFYSYRMDTYDVCKTCYNTCLSKLIPPKNC